MKEPQTDSATIGSNQIYFLLPLGADRVRQLCDGRMCVTAGQAACGGPAHGGGNQVPPTAHRFSLMRFESMKKTRKYQLSENSRNGNK